MFLAMNLHDISGCLWWLFFIIAISQQFLPNKIFNITGKKSIFVIKPLFYSLTFFSGLEITPLKFPHTVFPGVPGL